ncbi:MAG: hypothetical protein HQK51_09320 [Oligoflexia bacterium]|nr:hypothetical protein [Oligoflexia bacterium]
MKTLNIFLKLFLKHITIILSTITLVFNPLASCFNLLSTPTLFVPSTVFASETPSTTSNTIDSCKNNPANDTEKKKADCIKLICGDDKDEKDNKDEKDDKDNDKSKCRDKLVDSYLKNNVENVDELNDKLRIINITLTVLNFLIWTIADRYIAFSAGKSAGCNTHSRLVLTIGVATNAILSSIAFLIDVGMVMKAYDNSFLSKSDNINSNQLEAVKFIRKVEEAKLASLTMSSIINGIVLVIWGTAIGVAVWELLYPATCESLKNPEGSDVMKSAQKYMDENTFFCGDKGRISLATFRMLARATSAGGALGSNIEGLIDNKNYSGIQRGKTAAGSATIIFSMAVLLSIYQNIKCKGGFLGTIKVNNEASTLVAATNTAPGRLIFAITLFSLTSTIFGFLVKLTDVQKSRFNKVNDIVNLLEAKNNSNYNYKNSFDIQNFLVSTFSIFINIIMKQLLSSGYADSSSATDKDPLYNYKKNLSMCFTDGPHNNQNSFVIDGNCSCKKTNSCKTISSDLYKPLAKGTSVKNTMETLNKFFKGDILLTEINLDDVKKNVEGITKTEENISSNLKKSKPELYSLYVKAKENSQKMYNNLVQDALKTGTPYPSVTSNIISEIVSQLKDENASNSVSNDKIANTLKTDSASNSESKSALDSALESDSKSKNINNTQTQTQTQTSRVNRELSSLDVNNRNIETKENNKVQYKYNTINANKEYSIFELISKRYRIVYSNSNSNSN